MKIGIVTTWFERGAAYVSRQYRDVLESQHEVFIYARGGEEYAIGDPSWDGQSITWGKRTAIPISTALDLDDFRRWIVSHRLDMVLFNEQRWWEPVVLCNQMGIKTGCYVDYYTEETLPLFGSYDFLLCNTKRHSTAFDWHPQALYVPWGTDTALFTPSESDATPRTHVRFFHSAGSNPVRKGTDLLIRAMTRVQGPARLVIHSQTSLRKSFPDLAVTIDSLQADGVLECHEQTVGAPGLYHLGDVYVYPSRLDGIGLTIAEALSCGLPVITSDNPPMNEFVSPQSGKLARVSRLYARSDGYYWPQCVVDVDSLAACMQEFVDGRADLAAWSRNARNQAVTHMDWRKNAAQLPVALEKMHYRSDDSKTRAVELAMQYERQRPWHQRLPRRYARLFGFVQRIASGRKGGVGL